MQTREHLFKECLVWRCQIRALWREVGEASGRGVDRRQEQGKWKNRKDLSQLVSSQTQQLTDGRYTDAVLGKVHQEHQVKPHQTRFTNDHSVT